MKKIYKHLLAIFVPIVLLFLAWQRMGFYYSTNDDRCLTELLAGIVTMQPDAHLVYVNYLLSLPLSLLYKITTAIPWFGICLVLFYYLSYVFVLESAYARSKNIFEDFVFTVVIAFFFLSNFYLVGQMTYTAIAAFVAVSGYVTLLLHPKKKVGLTFFIILEAFAFLLRDQAMLMIAPLGLSVVCIYILTSDFSMWKTNLLKCLRYIGIILAIVVIGFLGNKLGYLGDDWATYEKFNDARTTLCDYTDFPPYDEVKDILDKHGVSQAAYEGFAGYTILNYDISVECLSEIAEYAKSTSTNGLSFTDAIKELYSISTEENTLDYYHMNKVLLLTLVCVFLYILLSGSFKMLLPFAALFLAKNVVWIYLVMAGRYPQRVTIPLMISETLLLIAIAFMTYVSSKKGKNPVAILRLSTLLVIVLLFCKTSYTNGQMQYRDIKRINEGQKAFITGLCEMTDYCNQNPDNKYIVETASLRWYSGSVFETSIFEPRNYVIAGGWFSNMPCVLEKNEAYFEDSSDGFHLIIYSDGEEMQHSSVKYLAELSDSTPKIVDTFTASHGGVYSVIYFDGELKIN